jgi:Ser/Thr protein kinase RdoA (MazF antagonist)
MTNDDSQCYAGDLIDLITTEFDVGRPIQIRALQIARNRTYRVQTDRGDFALRIRGDNWWIKNVEESDLRFELDLLDHLAAHGVPVSTAIPRRNGDKLGVLEDRQGSHWFSLFTWAPGEPGARTPEHAALVGRTLAKLHRAADLLTPKHSRFHIDEAAILDCQLPRIEAEFPTDRPEDVRLICDQIEEIRHRLATFDPGAAGWGIIHGDVQELNLHISDGELTFIDFDLCAWSWRTADIAEYYTRIPPPHRDPFLTGYETVRPLNSAEHDMLLTIARLAWIREGCTSHALAQMFRDPFIRFRRDGSGRWQMTPP